MKSRPHAALRPLKFALMLAAAPIFATATAGHADTTQPAAESTSTDSVNQEFSETLEAIKDYSAEKKDEAVAKGEELLNSMDEQLASLKAKAGDAAEDTSEGVKEKWDASMTKLSELRDAAGDKLEAMKASSAEAWEDVKNGFSEAVEDFNATLDESTAETES